MKVLEIRSPARSVRGGEPQGPSIRIRLDRENRAFASLMVGVTAYDAKEREEAELLVSVVSFSQSRQVVV